MPRISVAANAVALAWWAGVLPVYAAVATVETVRAVWRGRR